MNLDLPNPATIAALSKRPAQSAPTLPAVERVQAMVPATWYAAALGHMRRHQLVHISAAWRHIIAEGLRATGHTVAADYQPEIRGERGGALNHRWGIYAARQAEIRRRYAAGETLTRIAADLGISLSYASNIKDGR